MTPQFKYCPFCATPLIEKNVSNVLRPTCPACGFISFLEPKLVTVVVVGHAGKILLGRRNMNPALGKWTFFGGYVDRGEKVEDAAIREVKEETNLDVQLDTLLGLYSEQDNPHVLVAYAASIINDDTSSLAPQPDEISELAFFTLEELPELAFAFDMQILEDWKKRP
ncbi:MAG TPA: NUDIX domain-containing protein [Ktedonobacteraceae bacterium]|nr:NUDIX domain-containing protein [Ktedonobacteraceae bacterium]